MKRILGVDVDGVLADFNANFIDKMIDITGRDLFPPRPFDIPVWQYPAHYGYTRDEEEKVWHWIMSSPSFWETLPPYADIWESVDYLREQFALGADIYYVTSRPGFSAKAQTERWLKRLGLHPTVLISSTKGLAARTLGFSAYIDDRYENAIDVATTGARSVLINRPWNTAYNVDGLVIRTDRLAGFAELPPVELSNTAA